MSVLELTNASRWYGNVVAVNDITMEIGPGVTGLLGPNGAGKSTLIAMMSGFLAPSAGTATLDGATIWQNTDVYKQIGLVPEREVSFGYLTGRQFVRANAALHKLPDPKAAADRAIDVVELADAADRRIGTYSKGMRQRIKIASALVHDPQVLLLDEPFNGVDPRQRVQLMSLLQRMGAEGRTVLFSSHILEEVEQVARQIEVDGVRAARRLRRLRRDPAADDRPAGSVRRREQRRPRARRGADGRTVGPGGRAAPPGRRRRRGQRLRRLRPPAAGASRATRRHPAHWRSRPTDESLESVFSYLVSA